jgi:hypothetical protein
MKIRFRQTGGFAGLAKSVEIDCERLPPEEAAFFRSLVDQAGFFELPEPPQRSLPDEEQYSITVEATGRARHLYMSRSGVPAPLRPLVDYLIKRATYEKRR